MPFEPGQSGNPSGRPKGATSIKTSKFKEALNKLLEDSSDEMMEWLSQIDDPKTRFDVLKDFSEYIHPKLARTEQRLVDGDGNDKDMTINLNRIVYNADNRDK